MKIAPSLLAADFLHLENDLQLVNRAGDILHLDIMDGTLVPNISFGFSVLEALPGVVTVPMDVHLMTVEPQQWFEKVARCGAAMCSFHLEASGRRASKFIDAIHSFGMKAGLAIDPDIPVRKLYPYIGKADYFLVMSVFAGFGGQKFIPETLDRVKALKAEIAARGASPLVEIDGGVNLENAPLVREAGVDIAVAGSTVFKSSDPEATVRALRGA